MLPPKDPARGITPDMSIPIIPNEQHPSGRTPIRSSTPFQFRNCNHWAYNGLRVRVRHNLKKYRGAVEVSMSEQMRMETLVGRTETKYTTLEFY